MSPARIEAMKTTAESWSASNPYKQQLLDRLESLGGQYAPSRTADRRTEREQPRVDHTREVAESKAAGGLPF